MRQCLNKLIDEEIIDEVLEFRIKVKQILVKKNGFFFRIQKDILVLRYLVSVMMAHQALSLT